MSEKAMTLHEKLVAIQSELKAPKSRKSGNGNEKFTYSYRSCEDILGALKDLLQENNCTVNLTDEIVQVGNCIYVKATATISDGQNQTQAVAFAREPDKLGSMSACQITGSASSYARKYALNGLFAIDNNQDPDSIPQVPQGQNQCPQNGHYQNGQQYNQPYPNNGYWQN